MGVIYMATCSITNKSYIGQTKDFSRRKQDHLRAVDNYPFHLALRKYGEENFVWTILENCDDELLDEKEKYWISYYETYKKGYNATEGGDNANALVSWIKNNPNKAKENALKGLEKANEYWRLHPEEKRQQLEIAHKNGGKAVSKKVRCVETNLIFDSLSNAEAWTKSENNPNGKVAQHQSISKVCKGIRKTAGGYHWIYIEE